MRIGICVHDYRKGYRCMNDKVFGCLCGLMLATCTDVVVLMLPSCNNTCYDSTVRITTFSILLQRNNLLILLLNMVILKSKSFWLISNTSINSMSLFHKVLRRISTPNKSFFENFTIGQIFKSVIHTFCGGVLVNIRLVGGFGREDLNAARVLSNRMVENGYEI